MWPGGDARAADRLRGLRSGPRRGRRAAARRRRRGSLLGDDLAAPLLGSKRASRGGRLAALGRASLGEPLLEAAVEDRDIFRAEMAEHEPAARGGAQPANCRRRRYGRRARSRGAAWRGRTPRRRAAYGAPGLAVAHLVDVEEARAGNVGGEIFVAAVAAGRGHVPARNPRRRPGSPRCSASHAVETSNSMRRGHRSPRRLASGARGMATR